MASPELRQCLRLLLQWLVPERLMGLARKTKFIQRKPKKIFPVPFVQAAVMLVSQSRVSVRRWAALLGILGYCSLAKQSLWERITDGAAEFLKGTLALVLGQRLDLSPGSKPEELRFFQRVLLQDSTLIQLAAKLAAIFAGSSNQHGAKHGQLRIQTVYELFTQQFVSFSMSGFNRNDQAAAKDILSLLQPGDLVLRDLGYFVLDSFQAIAQAGAFFLSRLRLDTNLFDLRSGKPLNLLGQLRRYGRLDSDVLLGNQKLPVRLVAIKLPEAVAAERRRKAKQNRDRRCRPNARHLALLGWAIFITNVSREVWKAKTVAQIYGLRWRIETIFKAWKSHFRITEVPDGSEAQLLSVIYARLIFITVLAQICSAGWLDRWKANCPPPRSLLKIAGLVGDFFLILCLVAWGYQINRIVEAWFLQFVYHGRYDQRSRVNYAQIFAKLS